MTKFSGVLLTALLGACTASAPERHASTPEVSATCDSFSFQRGTPAYAQCADEVDKAYWRAARSRSRVNCTPMGNQTVCQ